MGQDVSFEGVVLLAGRTATGIDVPDEVVAALGGGRQPLVHVKLGEHAYRSRLGVRGGIHKLPVSAEHREAAGVAAGDRVVVTLALDTEPREVAVPDALAAALDRDPQARRALETLSASRQRALVDPIAQARTPETRQRRVDKALATLREQALAPA